MRSAALVFLASQTPPTRRAPETIALRHHRSRFEPAVQAALGLLDRVAEGQRVDERDVELALQVTGDAEPVARPLREGPTWRREKHPMA